jgi:hypothetical protein
MTIIKVEGENNVASVLTQHVERSKLGERMKSFGFVRRSGRHELCLQLGESHVKFMF